MRQGHGGAAPETRHAPRRGARTAVTDGARRVRNAISRRVDRARHHVERVTHPRHLPTLTPDDQHILGRLRRDLVVVSSVSELSFPRTPEVVDAARVLADELATRPIGVLSENRMAKLSHTMYADPVRIARQHPEIFLWGVQDRILDLLEHYLRVPVCCFGASIKRDLADSRQTGSRVWHMDGEDDHVIRIIIYLDDVTEENGPFEYVPRSRGVTYDAFGNVPTDRYLSDADMAAVVPADEWRPCCGPGGTVILGDVANVFHHIKLPTAERYSLVYSYASRRPLRPWLFGAESWGSGISLLAGELTRRQRESIWDHRSLLGGR